MKAETEIVTDGHQRWLVVRWEETLKGTVECRERWPLHMDKLDDEKRKWFMERVAKRLHDRVKRRVGVK